MAPTLQINPKVIADFCHRWKVSELALFGSALRDDFKPESDVDLLVSFQEDAHTSLFDLSRMETELEVIFGRDVDLVTKEGIEHSRNPYRRKEILSTAKVFYAA